MGIVAVASGNQSDAAALHFRSHQDALDFAASSVEESNRILTVYNFGRVVENYRIGNLGICATVRIGGDLPEYDLIFLSIEEGRPETRGFYGRCGKFNDEISKGRRNKSGMLFRVAKLVQSPEGAIPSFVRLESCKKRSDFRMQTLNAVDLIGVEFLSPNNGKVCEVESGASVGRASGVGCLIEAGPQIIDRIEDDAWQIVGERFPQFDLMNFCDAISVAIDVVGPRVFLHKGLESGAQITNVVLCTTERAFGAREQVGHGQIRSDERPEISAGGEALPDYATATT